MKLFEAARRALQNTESTVEGLGRLNQRLLEVCAGIANQSDATTQALNVSNQQLAEIVSVIANQSDFLREIVSETAKQSDLFRELLANSIQQSQHLSQQRAELVAGIANQSDLLNRKLVRLIEIVEQRASYETVRDLTESQDEQVVSNELIPEPHPDYADRQIAFVNRMEPYSKIFEGVTPWSGFVERGLLVDFSGALTDASFTGDVADQRFGVMIGADPAEPAGCVRTRLPVIEDGEIWFEAVNWVMAAREAKDQFVMMSLGAGYGAQVVGSYRVLQHLNPMPCKLIAVEAEPENCERIESHLRGNGLDPASHWLVPHALSGNLAPVLFPVGAPGSGAQNAISTNDHAARRSYVDLFTRGGARQAKIALRNLLLHNTTGLTHNLVEGHDFKAEIKLLSAITLHELLSPFERIDYLECDIQQSEIVVFPPFIDLLRKKVRRIHIGTHGKDVHWALHDLFAENCWQIVFSFEPNSRHETILGSFETNDGVLTVVNPGLLS
jgi:hypothetical protein